MGRKMVLVIGSICLALIMLACTSTAPAPAPAPTPAPAPAPAPAPTPAPAKPTGTLTIAFEQVSTEEMDPKNYRESTIYMDIFAMYEGLAMMGPGGEIVPKLATSWQMSADGLDWEFTLRQGVKFHNGDPFTAKDVKFSFDRYQGLGAETMHKKVKDVEVKDDYHVVFHLAEPYATFFNDLIYPVTLAGIVVPKDYIERVGDEEFGKNPIGTGPFRFVEKKVGDYHKFEAFEDYWGGPPKVKTVINKLITEPSTRVAALLSGEVDIISALPIQMIPVVEKTAGFRVMTNPSAASKWVAFFDQADPKSPTYDKRVRQALNYAVDKEAIVKTILSGLGTPSGQTISRVMPGWVPDIKPYPYDPVKAKQLLAEAGYPNGFNITLNVHYAPQTYEAVAGYLRDVGLNVEVVNWESGAYIQKSMAKSLNGLGSRGSAVFGDASYRIASMEVTASKSVWSYHTNSKIDELYEKSLVTMNQVERYAIIAEIEKISYEEAYHLWLYDEQAVWGVSDRIGKDWKPVKGLSWPVAPNDIPLTR